MSYSLKDFCTIDNNLLMNFQFYIHSEAEAFDQSEIFYFELKKKKIIKEGENQQILQFTDISTRIKYDVLTGNQQLLQTINATVSHEMRNPLNSIMSQNLKQEELAKRLDNIVDSLTPENAEESKVLLKELSDELK